VAAAGEISGNRFRIAGGESGAKVSWQLTGVRIGPYAKARPVEVREPKRLDDTGLYLHPEAYGRDKADGLADREGRSREAR
jgi:hypothetical protein